MRIEVQNQSRAQTVEVEVLEHDCYEDPDYIVEAYTFYQPSPQQIDEGTDRDETGYVAVCQKLLMNGEICGKDMPDIDVEPDFERGED